MEKMLQLQTLDLKIEQLTARETSIPSQKNKYDLQRKQLQAEIDASEQRWKSLEMEQRDCESEIGQRRDQIKKYEAQLMSVKKNDEYQALLHEIEMEKKQIGIKEERILNIMEEMDSAKAKFQEDKARIDGELQEIVKACEEIDEEQRETRREREELERQRKPLAEDVNPKLLSRYTRIRKSKKVGAAVVPLHDEFCSGCHMKITPQVVNEILGGEKMHSCAHCGRMLYNPDLFDAVAVKIEQE